MKTIKFNFKLIASNFPSGLVVFLVALPLCLGIALASGAPPLAGIISGVIGGIVVGALSNSHVSVSGPAAGLTAIIFAAITELNSFELFLVAGIIAGVIQLIMGFVKAGSISNYFPNNVIEGMLAGIGVIIIMKQLPHAVGFSGTGVASDLLLDTGFYSSGQLYELVKESIHPGALLITAVSLSILLIWDNVKTLKKIKMLPGALVAVVSSIVINQIFISTGSSLAITGKMLVNLPVIESFSEVGQLFTLPDFAGFLNPKVWTIGVTIAIVASIETLLCVDAADKMDPVRRMTNTNLELKAQGVGNLISSLLGGLPMTSVVVRTSVNISSGATSKFSSIIHGVLLVITVLSIPFLLNMIPLAALSAILLIIGYKLAKPAMIVHFWKKGRSQFIPFIATIIAVVSTDLLMGVALGMVISVTYILLGNMRRAYYLSEEEMEDVTEVSMILAEEVSFLNKAAIKQTLRKIRPGSKMTIDASSSTYIATDVLDMIEEFANYRCKEEGIQLNLIGFKTSYRDAKHDRHSHVVVKHSSTI